MAASPWEGYSTATPRSGARAASSSPAAFWSCDTGYPGGINGVVDGNAIERNYGDIVIDPGTTLNGYAEENGPGEVIDNR